MRCHRELVHLHTYIAGWLVVCFLFWVPQLYLLLETSTVLGTSVIIECLGKQQLYPVTRRVPVLNPSISIYRGYRYIRITQTVSYFSVELLLRGLLCYLLVQGKSRLLLVPCYMESYPPTPSLSRVLRPISDTCPWTDGYSTAECCRSRD